MREGGSSDLMTAPDNVESELLGAAAARTFSFAARLSAACFAAAAARS